MEWLTEIFTSRLKYNFENPLIPLKMILGIYPGVIE